MQDQDDNSQLISMKSDLDHDEDSEGEIIITEAEIRAAFQEIDRDGNDHVELHELREAMLHLHPHGAQATEETAKFDALVKECFQDLHDAQLPLDDDPHLPRQHLRSVSYSQFRRFYIAQIHTLHRLYHNIDHNHDGRLTAPEIHRAVADMGLEFVAPEDVQRLIDSADANRDGVISWPEFRDFLLLHPHKHDPRQLFTYFSLPFFAIVDDRPSFLLTTANLNIANHNNRRKLIAGAIAGCLSATLVSPIDRVRILMQASRAASPSLAAIVRQIWSEGGPRAFFRGNGVNLLRIGPESALMFYLFDAVRAYLLQRRPPAAPPPSGAPSRSDEDGLSLPILERFVAGAFAGTTAQAIMYPLNTTRVHLAVAPRGTYRGLWDCVRQIVRAQGVKGLYVGNGLSTVGNVPYYAIELGTFSLLKESLAAWYATHFPAADPRDQQSRTVPLLMAGMASSFSALVATYPVWTIRTLLQTQKITVLSSTLATPTVFSGPIDCGRHLLLHHGFKGLYRGLIPSTIRLVPAQSLTYTLFTKLSEFF